MDTARFCKSVAILLLFLACPWHLRGQGLKKDEVFFKSQQKAYQEWLDLSGLGELLQVETITVEEDKVNLYLKIPSPYSGRDDLADYVRSAWRKLGAEYNKKNSIGLEAQLFLKMIHLMELEPGQATVQLYDTYDTRLKEYVFYGIYYEGQGIKIDSSLTKDAFHSFPVYVPELAKSAQTGINVNIGHNDSTFRKIHAFARQRFEKSGASISEQLVDFEEGIYVLSVKPLYREVLKDQQNLLICEWLRRLSLDCTTLKKEWLTFTFVVNPTTYGYRLDCTLNGKCTEKSTLWNERGEYSNIDQDLKSWKILKDYGDGLMTELRQFLR
ncbi:MAG: hypothetical protein H6573_32165 [Lewinellaceae bacterium]|nr:hypothetical protein [Phaeodactylibacter sp.]MCB9352114.1 hypothetical protein [Lewinellaceae bacterium]